MIQKTKKYIRRLTSIRGPCGTSRQKTREAKPAPKMLVLFETAAGFAVFKVNIIDLLNLDVGECCDKVICSC